MESESNQAELTNAEGNALSLWQKITYAAGEFSVSLAPMMIASWLLYFYCGQEGGNKYLAYTVYAGVILIGRFLEPLANIFVGYLSDRTHTKLGRRMPWIIFGTPLLAAFSVLIWFPITDSPSVANAVWLAFTLGGFWFSYVAVVAPYLSLLPEITPYLNERIWLSTTMGYYDVLGALLGTIGAGYLINLFSSGVNLGLFKLGNGYQLTAIIFAILVAVSFFLSIAFVRETPYTQAKAVPFDLIRAIVETFKNPAFIPYVILISMMRISIDSIVAIIPFMVIKLCGSTETTAGILQGLIILLAALLFPLVSLVSLKWGKKKVFLIATFIFIVMIPFASLLQHAPIFGLAIAGVAKVFGVSFAYNTVKLLHLATIFVLLGFSISALFVLQRPIFADIVDHDEKLTGYRREAMYNGMEGLVTKVGSMIAGALPPILLTSLGDSAERPWGMLVMGPLSSFLLIIGFIAFLRYPFKR